MYTVADGETGPKSLHKICEKLSTPQKKIMELGVTVYRHSYIKTLNLNNTYRIKSLIKLSYD